MKEKFFDLILLLASEFPITVCGDTGTATMIYRESEARLIVICIALTLDRVPDIKYDHYFLIGNTYEEFEKLSPLQSFQAKKHIISNLDDLQSAISIIKQTCQNQ